MVRNVTPGLCRLLRWARLLPCAVGGVGLLVACQTTKPVPMGIQPEFAAVNPSRILAVPVFTLPNPGRPSQVDLTRFEGDGANKAIEAAVLGAFKNQPNVNGVSFQAVGRALGAPPNAWSRMADILKTTSAKLTSTVAGERATLGKDCLSRRNFLDFYVYCLMPQKAWVDELNALSTLILNADTALLTVVTDLGTGTSSAPPGADAAPTLEAEAAVLIVDTNTGKLIWGREARTGVQGSGPDARTPPEASALFSKLFSDAFWQDFPGRRQPVAQETPGK